MKIVYYSIDSSSSSSISPTSFQSHLQSTLTYNALDVSKYMESDGGSLSAVDFHVRNIEEAMKHLLFFEVYSHSQFLLVFFAIFYCVHREGYHMNRAYLDQNHALFQCSTLLHA